MDYVVIFLVAAGCINDVKKGLIPKWCTVPVFALGIAHNVMLGGWNGLAESLIGSLGIVSIYLTLNSVLRISFGDIKLLMGAGAYAGAKWLPLLLIVMFTLSCVMLLVRFIKRNKTYTPIAFYRAARNQLKFGPTEERVPFAPYIGVPFIVYLLFQNLLMRSVV